MRPTTSGAYHGLAGIGVLGIMPGVSTAAFYIRKNGAGGISTQGPTYSEPPEGYRLIID